MEQRDNEEQERNKDKNDGMIYQNEDIITLPDGSKLSKKNNIVKAIKQETNFYVISIQDATKDLEK